MPFGKAQYLLATHAGLRKCVWSSDRTLFTSYRKQNDYDFPNIFIPHRRAEQGARPAIPTQVAVDKLATKCKCKNQIKSIPNVIKASRVLRVATINVRKLKNKNKMSEISALANATQLDIICLHEHIFIYEDVDTKEYSIG